MDESKRRIRAEGRTGRDHRLVRRLPRMPHRQSRVAVASSMHRAAQSGGLCTDRGRSLQNLATMGVDDRAGTAWLRLAAARHTFRYDSLVIPARPRDTSPDADSAQFQLLRRMTPQQRAEIMTALTFAVQDLAMAGVRQRFPGESEDQLRLRLAADRLGENAVRRIWPNQP